MTLRTTPDDDAIITRIAERQGVSKNEAVLRAVRVIDEQQSHSDQVGESASKMLDRYSGLFERLRHT